MHLPACQGGRECFDQVFSLAVQRGDVRLRNGTGTPLPHSRRELVQAARRPGAGARTRRAEGIRQQVGVATVFRPDDEVEGGCAALESRSGGRQPDAREEIINSCQQQTLQTLRVPLEAAY